MPVTVDPHKRFVAAVITPVEYARLMQRLISEMPHHLDPQTKVALAHLAVMEMTVRDESERANARRLRKHREEQIARKTSGLYIPGRA